MCLRGVLAQQGAGALLLVILKTEELASRQPGNVVFSDDLRGSAVLASGSVFAKGRTWYQITQVIFSLPEKLGPIFPIIKNLATCLQFKFLK